MTPKEKAEELYFKYYKKLNIFSYKRIKSKRCALIAVDEILQIVNIWSALNMQKSSQVIYWEEVKEELEKI